MNFGWKAGYAKDYYGYSNNIRRNSYYSMGLSGHYKIFDGWIGYTDRDLKGIMNHRYWTYYRDMHSFYAWIRYDDIEKETKFMIMPKDFKF